jgi:hypothetical protein
MKKNTEPYKDEEEEYSRQKDQRETKRRDRG